MKRFNYIGVTIAFSMLAMVFTGCKKFLDFEPYGPPQSNAFWKTEADAINARNALTMWVANEGIDGRGHMWFENCSDNLVTGRPQAEGDQIKNFQMSANNGRDWRANWPMMFRVIAASNNIFSNVPDMAIPQKTKDNVIGEAYFFRAFAYLWLAPWYGDNGPNGGIPIITEKTPVEQLDMPRPKSVLENYDMIIADMRKAADLLPLFSQVSNDEKGRPHKAAAWALAARAALYAAQYDAKYYDIVMEMTQKVMEFTGADKRELYPNYAEFFTEANNFSSEYIYAITGTAIDGPKFPGMSFQNGGWGIFNTWGYFQPTLELYKAYETGDKRRAATILYPGEKIQYVGRDITWAVNPSAVSSTSGMTFRKWMSPFAPANAIGTTVNTSGNNASTRLNISLVRFADILLMRAEALIWGKGEGNAEAKQLINRVRQRAGLPANSAATKAQLMNERRCELAFEFLPSRHIDLVRWGIARQEYAKPLHGVRTTLNAAGEIDKIEEIEIWPARNFDPSKNHVFPIPAAEIAKGVNLKQNNGY